MAVGCYLHTRVSDIDVLLIPRDKAKWVFARALFGYISYMFQFWGIFLLPFSLAVVLYFTQPISASIISFIFNGEKLSCLQIISIFFAMLGVIILTSPSLIFPFVTERSFKMEDYPYFYHGVVIALLGSISSGFAYLSMRKMGSSVNSVICPMYFGIFSCYANFFGSAALGDDLVEEYSWPVMGLLLLTGIFGWLAQEGVSAAV